MVCSCREKNILFPQVWGGHLTNEDLTICFESPGQGQTMPFLGLPCLNGQQGRPQCLCCFFKGQGTAFCVRRVIFSKYSLLLSYCRSLPCARVGVVFCFNQHVCFLSHLHVCFYSLLESRCLGPRDHLIYLGMERKTK